MDEEEENTAEECGEFGGKIRTVRIGGIVRLWL